MTTYRYWAGIVSSFLLFSLVFLGQRDDVLRSMDNEHRGEIGLLLFMIPGFIASALSGRRRICCPLIGTLCALPLCLIVRYFRPTAYWFWQELAYATSAVFWCLSGAMLFLCIKVMLQACRQGGGNGSHLK
ncbi:MAG: inner membrane protein YbjM [Gibbsiella quercinecans]|uniref:inner membrane protein YbjM n=1 Tax=Gibbsiella quercinecans TaxID=929813 RepID=UPI003F3EE648